MGWMQLNQPNKNKEKTKTKLSSNPTTKHTNKTQPLE